MYALFEEGGKFLAGRLMAESDTSVQVELDSGKRVKVKAANVLLKFAEPPPADLIASAQALAARTLNEAPAEDAARIDYAFRLCTARTPTTDEREALRSVLETQTKSFGGAPDDAKLVAERMMGYTDAGQTAYRPAPWAAISASMTFPGPS